MNKRRGSGEIIESLARQVELYEILEMARNCDDLDELITRIEVRMGELNDACSGKAADDDDSELQGLFSSIFGLDGDKNDDDEDDGNDEDDE